jgi:hypothetical protein
MTGGQTVSLSWNKATIWGLRPDFFTVRQLRVCWCGALSLMRGRVCRLQLLLVLASTVIPGSESMGLMTTFYCLRFKTSISFASSYHSQGHGGRIQVKVKDTLPLTVGQTVCWCRAPQDVSSYMKVTVLSIWGALSHERSGLSFVSHSLY